MNDVKCPYCGTEQEINHECGYGYTEEDMHEQSCVSCNKDFNFTTSITYCYNVYCANERDHIFNGNMDFCTKCDYEKF